MCNSPSQVTIKDLSDPERTILDRAAIDMQEPVADAILTRVGGHAFARWGSFEYDLTEGLNS